MDDIRPCGVEKEGSATKMTAREYRKQVYNDASMIATRYLTMKRQIRYLQDEIIHAQGGCADGMPRGSGTGDPTATKAERMIRSLTDVQRKVDAVEKAFAELRDEHERTLIRKNVFEGIPVTHIDVPISSRTCQRIRGQFIWHVALNLGMYWRDNDAIN